MVFNRLAWQKKCRKVMGANRAYSYAKLAKVLHCSKSFVWAMLNTDHANITIENMLLISRILNINPLDYIIQDEVQLELL